MVEAQVETLEQRVAELERRVAGLETRPAGSASAATGGAADGARARSLRAATVTLLDRLRESIGASDGASNGASDGSAGGERADDPTGTIAYAGAVGVGEHEYAWAMGHGVADLVALDWSPARRVLECLGSPARLALLGTLVRGPRSRIELQEALGETSTGHLYHHLRELQSAGLLHQRRRGTYELPAQAMVPLLVIVAAALDLGGEPTIGSEPTGNEP
jgi:DNA-binding transcriptional ArsR family regulator